MAAAQKSSPVWVFEQIQGPPDDRKILTLSGWYAPFGRPRKDPVIKEIIKSRIQTVRYPGSSAQTRHAFGVNWEPTELQGRWMTKAGGNTAEDMANDWTDFIKDERTCRIAWGNIVSYIGYVEELELHRESEHEIAWKMKLQIDERDDARSSIDVPAPIVRPDNDMTGVETWMHFSEKLKQPNLPNMSPDFLESLDNLAAELNKPSAALAKFAGQIDDLEKRTFSTLKHFKAALTGLRTSILNIRDTVINAPIDAVLLVRSTAADIAWVRYQLDLDHFGMQVAKTLMDIIKEIESIETTFFNAVVTARDGDSWESISIRATGGPGAANEIRKANGIRYGDKPITGETYIVQNNTAPPAARLRTIDRARATFLTTAGK